MASATHETFKKHATSAFIGVETWFKYQNNEQNLQIWEMQISQIA